MSKWSISALAAAQDINELDDLRLSIYLEPAEEPIHRFRVGYKKLRALFRMEGLVQEHSAYSVPRSLKKIYAAAGQVRDTQLLTAYIQEEMGDTVLVQVLDKQLRVQLQSLLIILQQTNGVRADVEPLQERLSDWKPVKELDYDPYFKGRIAEWLHLSRHVLYDDTLHELRKLLKDILYNYQFLHKTGRAGAPLLSLLPISEIDALQSLLGDYQDMVVRNAQVRQLALIPSLQMDITLVENWLSAAFRNQQRLRQQLEGLFRSLQHFFHLHAS